MPLSCVPPGEVSCSGFWNALDLSAFSCPESGIRSPGREQQIISEETGFRSPASAQRDTALHTCAGRTSSEAVRSSASWEGMMGVNGSLVCPAVNQENGFRILERLIVLLPQVPLLRADRLYRSALLHLAGKGTCCSIGSTVPQIDIDVLPRLQSWEDVKKFRLV